MFPFTILFTSFSPFGAMWLRYRHFKGNEYEVIGIARHSETEEPMVVYRALYGDHGLCVRPAEMWNKTVEWDGKVYKRFEYIGDEETEEVQGP